MKAPFQICIPKRAAFCCHCKKPFTAGQEIQSQLQEQQEKWLRNDSCLACFTKMDSAVTWKHVIGSEEKIEPEKQDRMEKMVELLQQLIESDDIEAHEEAFLLALYLCRKKIVAHRVKMGLYENLESGEMYLIPKIDFSRFSAYDAQMRLQKKL